MPAPPSHVAALSLAACLAAASPAPASDLALSFTVERGALPRLPYLDLTLKVDALGASAADVTGDGRPVSSWMSGGKVVFTTAARDVVVTLRNPATTAGAGAVQKAVLKHDRLWAWSHGFDDNTMLQPGIALFRARGWRATVFMICSQIDDLREESWILDAPALKQLLAQGWSVGNHTWDHGYATTVNIGRDSVVRCSDRLAGIVAASARAEYPVTAFAAPMFDAAYAPIIRGLRDSRTTHLLFDESGNDHTIRVDPGAPALPGVPAFSRDLVIGRYTPIGWDSSAAIAEIDSVAARAGATTHLWFNTLAHGSNEASLAPVLAHVYARYGPGGGNLVLVAPSDEIYSYLLVRDASRVVYNGTTAPSARPPRTPRRGMRGTPVPRRFIPWATAPRSPAPAVRR
jgi:peptidoglycan/xylan/chitin deacetylase (PgdA/CDA1 family)